MKPDPTIKAMLEDILKSLQTRHDFNLTTLPTSSQTRGAKEDLIEFIHQKTSSHPQYQNRILQELFEAGPLTPLITDTEVTEIIINGPEKIFVEKRGKILPLKDHFLSELTYRNFIQRITEESKCQVNLDQPFTDGRWRDFRVHLAIPPIVPHFPHCTLRKHPTSSWTFHNLLEQEWAPEPSLDTLETLVRQEQNLLVVGPTGSGKTSVVSACLNSIPPHQRVVAIEDSDELFIPNDISTKLLTRFDSQGSLKEITQEDLIKQALRMRPHRIVLGEVRGREAKDLILCFSTGHKGGFATLHAESAQQALWRLEVLTLLGAPEWNAQAVKSLISLSFDYVIVVEIKNGHRKLKEIVKISSLESSGFTFEQVWPAIKPIRPNSDPLPTYLNPQALR